MLERRIKYYKVHFYRYTAQSSSFSSSQATGVQNLGTYSCFLAKLASFSKGGETNV